MLRPYDYAHVTNPRVRMYLYASSRYSVSVVDQIELRHSLQ